ncbi:IS4 family transposase [candidate division KSB1 bacterium]|nr:IS4 family transposase [candidate division KSB1 bacterium]
MRRKFKNLRTKQKSTTFKKLLKPIMAILSKIPPLVSRGDRPLQMTFKDQLNALVFYHLEEHDSGTHLVQVLQDDTFAREHIAPSDGIKKSSFFEAINTRGLEQLIFVFNELQAKATAVIPKQFKHLGNLVAIDGSFINAVLSMTWADYRNGSKKAKVHLGFDINRSIPTKLYLTDGLAGERPFVDQILSSGQTGVLDRGYQCHERFDQWQEDGYQFFCRIKASTKKECLQAHECKPGSIVFYDATVLLGTPGTNQTKKPIRLVAYKIGGVEYWIATNRYDLSAEDVALAFKLRWDIEKFFAWWKRHLKVYHLIARSEYGLMVQILGGLITYLLLAIYCHENYNEKVTIKRVRELRIQIQNETRDSNKKTFRKSRSKKRRNYSRAKT